MSDHKITPRTKAIFGEFSSDLHVLPERREPSHNSYVFVDPSCEGGDQGHVSFRVFFQGRLQADSWSVEEGAFEHLANLERGVIEPRPLTPRLRPPHWDRRKPAAPGYYWFRVQDGNDKDKEPFIAWFESSFDEGNWKLIGSPLEHWTERIVFE